MRLDERIERDGITIESRSGTDPIPDEYVPGTQAWKVTLHLQDRALTTPFFTGPGLEMRNGPRAKDVLSCLLADAAMWENCAGDFERWCDSYGNDDAKTAWRTFRAVEKQTDELRDFLGEQFDAYMWESND